MGGIDIDRRGLVAIRTSGGHRVDSGKAGQLCEALQHIHEIGIGIHVAQLEQLAQVVHRGRDAV